MQFSFLAASVFFITAMGLLESSPGPARTVKIFIIAGQSNAVGADSHADRVDNYPPFVGAAEPQKKVRYAYHVGHAESKGWTCLQPVENSFGPELTFARKLTEHIDEPIAIIKSAVGGTTIAYDWNPDGPEQGQKLYARTVSLVKNSLKELKRKRIPYQLEAVIWHQGENDMLNPEIHGNYAEGFTRFIARLRQDLDAPGLKWFVGEISDKGIWGMDNRSNMQVLRKEQKEVVAADPLVWWVPTSHLAFEVMDSGQPHYHFGTLGQLQHGEAYAKAYLNVVGPLPDKTEEKKSGADMGPKIDPQRPVRLFLLMGQRNMEGEESFVQEIRKQRKFTGLQKPQKEILYRYSLGGGACVSEGWESLGPVEYLDYFGPELSFGRAVAKSMKELIAIVKVTDSAALMLDWAPEGGERESRPIYHKAVAFIRAALDDLAARECEVRVEGLFWLQGEHDTYFGPYQHPYRKRLEQVMTHLRKDLGQPDLRWFLLGQSEKALWGKEEVEKMNRRLKEIADADPHAWFLPTSPLSHGRIHFEAAGTLQLGESMAKAYLAIR